MVTEKGAMALKAITVFLIFLLFSLPIRARYLMVKKREWIGNSSPNIREGDVECFSEYMELWIHRMRIEGLRVWLSGTLRIPVSLVSLDHLNQQMSVCGFSLHRDPERNYIFRVMYSGCFVQLEGGNYVIVLNLLRRVSRFGGRTNSFVMKCPVATMPPSVEHIQCDPDFIQVTRQIPTDSWNNKLSWSLALRGNLVVALEDASLIQLNAEISGSSISVQGKRRESTSSEMVMEKSEEFLPLKLVSGHYAYSMEASCPNVSRAPLEQTVVHIFKRRMGVTKRGGCDRESLSVSSVFVSQTNSFSVTESSDFVELTIPTSLILKTKSCQGPAGEILVQPFFRVDAVLTYRETPHKVNWTMENFFPCTASPQPSLAMMETQEEAEAGLSQLSASDLQTTALPSRNLISMLKKLPSTENATRESTSTSALLSPGRAFEHVNTPTLSPVVVSPNTQGNVSHVTSASPSTAPTAFAQSTHHFLRASPHLESDPPLSEPHLLLPGHPLTPGAPSQTEQGAHPALTNPRVSATLTSSTEAMGWAGLTTALHGFTSGLIGEGLSFRPTASMSGEGEVKSLGLPPDMERSQNTTSEGTLIPELHLTSLNISESMWDSLLDMSNTTWEDGYLAGDQQLTNSSLITPNSSSSDEADWRVTAALAARSLLHWTAAMKGEGAAVTVAEDGLDSDQTLGVASSPAAALGQRLSSDTLASSLVNMSPSNGTASERVTPVTKGQFADAAPIASLNGSDSPWESFGPRLTVTGSPSEGTEQALSPTPAAWLNTTELPLHLQSNSTLSPPSWSSPPQSVPACPSQPC